MTSPAPEGQPRAVGIDPDAAARKQALRARVLQRRASAAARLPRLLQVCTGHATIACYTSSAPEPDTLALIEALHARGVRVLLPALRGHRSPAWGWFTGTDALVAGWRGIPEPSGPALGPDALAACSLIWASALLVTPRGVRLGTGGGWYDRALPHAAPDAVVATLVDDAEVVEDLPHEPWDLPVHRVVTQSRTLSVTPIPD